MSDSGVSVIVPVYNGEAHLAEAILSALEQTLAPLEVIVVDDGSRDRSADIARRFGLPVRCLRQENLGISAARNAGVEASRGRFLSFLDADDVWVPEKLALQVVAFERDPWLEAVFGHIEEFVEGEGMMREARTAPGFLPSTAMIRRASFDRVGLFSTEWVVAEWVDWYARASEAGLRTSMLPEVVTRRRLHGDNHGIRRAAEREQYVRVLKATLDRRRRDT